MPAGTIPACFVTQDERYIYTANYHEGNVLVYDKSDKTPRLARTISIAPGAGCHQVLLTGDYMLVPCLLLDQVNIYNRSHDFTHVGTIPFEPAPAPATASSMAQADGCFWSAS